jgi:MFS family permease
MWTASFNLGAFLGPTSAGFIVEAWNFRGATVIYFTIYLSVAALDLVQLIYLSRRGRISAEEGYKGGEGGGKVQEGDEFAR